MRIQHNIMAMNAYRNYNNNASALSKNLEKLSSGYKINRAGDDAAGLAISEKMRGQIAGLDAAQKNVKDGISLVKTAEGAMQEVQDMLKRMKYLATQSANGTYEKVDRDNLQMEVNQLKEEINRIGQNANFNGIHLLDGTFDNGEVTLGGGGSSSSASTAITIGALTGTKTDGAAGTPTTDAKATFDIDLKDLDVTGNAVENGKQYKLTIASQDIESDQTGGTGISDLAAAFNNKTVSIGGTTFDIAASGTKLTFTAQTNGSVTGLPEDDDTITLAAGTSNAPGAVPDASSVVVSGSTDGSTAGAGTPTAAKAELDFTNVTGENAIGSTLTIGGKTYEFVKTAGDAKDGNEEVVVAEDDDADTVLTALKTEVDKDTALTGKFTVAAANKKLTLTETTASGTEKAPEIKGTGFKAADGGGGAADMGKKLVLQIGDSAGEQLGLNIGTISTEVMGIDGVNISDAAGALAAIDTVRTATDYVSSVRGLLGAYQNRLEHTQNNLSVMAENIQDAESTIRDTDVANEMMSYVKNNILVQSAQAMLAQANQVPQGVLQLLG